jgi:branched-subunit amino acid permease
MSDQSDFNDEILKDKLGILLDEDNEIKKWNEGLLIKSLILFPIIIFIVGLFILNRPENLTDVLFVFLYPVALIFIGLLLLFLMRSKLK